MSKRLEITIFGTEYSVGMVRLSQAMVKAGMDVYGPRKWNRLVNDIALGTGAKTLAKEVGHTIGHPVKTVYRQSGITMQGTGFGMEVFWGGDFFPVEMVESKNRTLQPTKLMQEYKSKEILGVFWGRRESAMFFRWDDVTALKQEDLILSHDNLAPILARKRAFEIVSGITLKGTGGRRKDIEPSGEFEVQKHVFHVQN